MISILIETDGKKVHTSFKHEDTTLIENAIAVKYLEEIKLKLLDEFEYKSEFEISEGSEIDED